jgi:hypothetical protein
MQFHILQLHIAEGVSGIVDFYLQEFRHDVLYKSNSSDVSVCLGQDEAGAGLN